MIDPADNEPSNLSPHEQGCSLSGALKILIAFEKNPLPIRNGATKRVVELMQRWRQSGVALSLLVFEAPDEALYRFCSEHGITLKYLPLTIRRGFLGLLWRMARKVVSEIERAEMRKLRASLKFIRKLSFPNSLHIRRDIQFKEKELKQINKWVSELDINCIIVEYIWTAGILDAIPEGVVRVIDTHDVMHERLESIDGRHNYLGGEDYITLERNREAKILRLFDVVIAINGKDADSFRALLGDSPLVVTYSSGFWIENFSSEKENDLLWQRICDFRRNFDAVCLYIGSSHAGNVDGMQRFLDITFPRLQEVASWGLIVAGDICNILQISSRLSRRALLLGRVNNVTPLYQGADVVVNPVFVGSGLKIKNVEALCLGATLFTTPKGMEGFIPGYEKICFVAKSEHDMAEQMIAWLRGKQTVDADKVRDYAERMAAQSGFEKVKKAVEDVLRERTSESDRR